jgi:hypothetical protein
VLPTLLLNIPSQLRPPVTGFTLFGLEVAPKDYSSIARPVDTANISFSVSTTILSTLIIVIRIIMLSRMSDSARHTEGWHHQNPSRTAIEIIIESAALYALASLAYIPVDAMINGFTSKPETYYMYVQLFWSDMAVSSFPNTPSLLSAGSSLFLGPRTGSDHAQSGARSCSS